AERAGLQASVVHQMDVVVLRQPAALLGLVVQVGARVRRRNRDLDGMWIDLPGERDRLSDRLPALAGQTENERAVDGDGKRMAVAGEAPSDVEPDPLLDVVEDLLVA